MSHAEPLISICLPVYDGSAFLREAIESVLAQTYKDFELIISDDGSSDESPQIIAGFAATDPRIRVLDSGPRLGLFANYNRCLSAALGEYLKPFAQDDLLQPTFLEECADVLKRNKDVTLVSTGRAFIDAKNIETDPAFGEMPSTRDILGRVGKIGSWAVLRKSLLPVINFIGEPSAVMFRREAMGKGFDERFHHLGDLDYWLRILFNGDYYFVSRKLCRFRRHGANQSDTNEKQLMFLPDLLLLGENCEKTLEQLSVSRQEFIDFNLLSAAEHITTWVETKKLDPSSFNDSDFKGVAFQSLMLLSKRQAYSHKVWAFVMFEKLRRQREKQLRGMLGSWSWRWTQPLRQLNRFILDSAHTGQPKYSANRENMSDIIDQQREYLKYLRKQIIRVRSSRSWKLTTALRLGR